MFRNVRYTVISNAFSLLISAAVSFLVPKNLNVEAYGYLQLYIFYTGYIGFLHFGWADGLYLRYGGEYYEDLNKHIFSGQFWAYTILECILGIVVFAIGGMILIPDKKGTVVMLTGVSIVLLLPRTFLQYILQGTNRIREYAILSIIDKGVYIIGVLISLVIRSDSYVLIIYSDLTGKLFGLLYAAYQCRDIVLARPNKIMNTITEARANISVGIKLMIANIASMLIIGLVRVSIEHCWDVETFGKVSLTMSISNLLMVFIRAVALVMFPMLRRTDESRLSGIYSKMRTCLMVPLLGLLIIYYPAKVVLSAWLPQYSDSLIYMALLFPMCVFESKMSMLIETYMKTLRKEKWLLIVNVVTVILSIVVTGITVYWLHNLDLAIASIVALLAFRCVCAELMLAATLSIKVKFDIIWECVLTITFVSSSWFIGGLQGLAVYVVIYAIYLFAKRKEIIVITNAIISFIVGR